MHVFLNLLFFCFFVMNIHAQDERVIRDIYLKSTDQFESKLERRKWVVHSPLYELDINGDKLAEYLNIVKREGEDWFVVYDNDLSKLSEWQLRNWGKESHLYKLHVKSLSPKVIVGVLHYYEGQSDYVSMIGSSRLYFLSIDAGRLESIKLYKGPVVFQERRRHYGHYNLRHYEVTYFDFNKDGIDEIKVGYGNISRIYFYLGNGEWEEAQH